MIATNPKFTPTQLKITADARLRAGNLFLNGLRCAIPTTKRRYRKKIGTVNIALAGRKGPSKIISIDCLFLRKMVHTAPPSVNGDNPVTFDAIVHAAAVMIPA